MTHLDNPGPWVGEILRPCADRLVGLKEMIDTELVRWYAVVSPELAGLADGDVVFSNGEVSHTKADVVSMVTQLVSLQTLLDGAGVMQLIVPFSANSRPPR